jgi:hypothetical protein
MASPKRVNGVPLVPELVSWRIADWPPHVFPGTADSGRHLCQEKRDALVKAGALVRVGRELVVLGAGYMKWLKSQSKRVDDFKIAPNSAEHAAKRNNGKEADSKATATKSEDEKK